MTNLNNPNNLCSKLNEYVKTNVYPFHMPGHKRNTSLLGEAFPYSIDITEIDGFDDLHCANGILKKVSEKAEKLFGSEHSYMLVNGSTCGILAAVYSVSDYGDSIIAARNCHKAVYNGCMVNNLNIKYIYTTQDKKSGVSGSISPESVKTALEECPQAKAVIITSPTYEGVVSDIENIARAAHSFGVPLIVDNAHGAHQRFLNGSLKDPVECGADIVISGLHKTLPALTQTAAAHVNGKLVPFRAFEKALSMFETSSPSYILMASIDSCFDFLAESEKNYREYKENLYRFSNDMKQLNNLNVMCYGNDKIEMHDFFAFDYSKLVICTAGTSLSGIELMELLRSEYQIELEMAYPFYAVAMTSVCDRAEGFTRLAEALKEIDCSLTDKSQKILFKSMPEQQESCMSLREALKLTDKDAEKRGVSNKYIYAYPPGIPIIVPGEAVSEDINEYIDYLINEGVRVIEN